ncbi:MAG: hypothetical protein IT579_22070 [Verrucomicrobia subdivision 3 bacterium]|nr:hypothetical protein [Limisphaerales bacterium]
MKKLLLTVTTIAMFSSFALADIVYVTARPSPSGGGINPDGTYSDSGGADTSAVGTGAGAPARTGCRYFSNSFSNNVDGLVGFTLTPTLGVPGGVYRIHHNFSATALNVSTNISLSVTCSVNGSLSFYDSGTNFIRAAGNPANQWKFLGYLTNDAAANTPTIDFGFLGGEVNAGAQQRLLVDVFRFQLDEACLDTPVVGITGPLSANTNQVIVTGVSAAATNVNVYQDSGSGMVLIGAKTSGVTAGNNSVTVSGLVKAAQVAATQTITGQEGCVPPAGTLVGGGANPRLRVVYSIRETSSTGPVGAPGVTTNTGIHFLGSSNVVAGSPGSGPVLTPNGTWQTVTLKRGTGETVADAANAAGEPVAGSGYAIADSVTLQVFAYRTLHGVSIYSATAAQSSAVTSNDVFKVNWTWDAVPGAQGYRLLREVNSGGYNEFVDVAGNSYSDDNSGWTIGNDVALKTTQTDSSIQWSPTANSNPDALPGQWGTLESINFAIDDLSDTGPYDLYIDNLQNGATVFQTFETAPAGTTDYGFRSPSFSGTTSGNLLSAPNLGVVANSAADTGTKSFHLQFQWSGTNSTRWLRLTTSAVGNPQVDLNEAISIRFLLLPVGGSLPTAPSAPLITVSQSDGKTILNWVGGHRLQTSADVAGTYTNVTQVLSPNTYTNVTLGAFLSPWTNNLPDPARFFRLAD